MKISRRQIVAAFTLLEALLASTILAMAAVAVILPFSAGAQAAAHDARLALATNLAQDLMEEILAKSFNDPDGSEIGESGRIKWDDMRDYNNFTEPEGQITGCDGLSVTDSAALGLSRQSHAVPVYMPGQDQAKPATFLNITTEVFYRGQSLIKLTRLVYDNE